MARLDELKKAVSERISALLVKKGWTQQELADALEKPKSYISEILHGKKNLTLRVISEIEKALGAKILKIEPK